MATIAEFTIPSGALPFGALLVENPGTRIEIERIVPTDESIMPFFWVYESDPEQFLEQAEREPEVSEIHLLARVDDGALFRAEWTPEAEMVRSLSRLAGTIIEAEGTSEFWRVELRAQDSTALWQFQKLFQDQGIPVTLVSLYNLEETIEGSEQTLTPKQRETLIIAFQRGYFDSPREVSREELGEHFDISPRAVSERLRRGTRNLITSTLLPPDD